jgi:simple sugar transport system ATP-binding protein
MVFQHFSLFEALNVAENVALGMENPPPMKTLAAKITQVSQAYGLPLDPARMVGDLSAGERQRVEIIRCLLQDPKLLIMDEPTSVLTPQEVDILFKTLRQLAAEGTAILYISHKLEEIRSLCDAATILRRGKVVGSADPKTSTARELAEAMVGATLTPPERAARRYRCAGAGAPWAPEPAEAGAEADASDDELLIDNAGAGAGAGACAGAGAGSGAGAGAAAPLAPLGAAEVA